jgi:hypothetical protein
MKPSADTLISDLTEVFQRLPILATESKYLTSYIEFLANQMSDIVHLPYPGNFTNKPALIVPELKELSTRSADLLAYLSTIHQSTILALIDVSARNNLNTACEQMIEVADATLRVLNPSGDSSSKANTGGRPRKDRALQLAVTLAGNYQRLTGKPPTIPVNFLQEGNPAVGEFHRLVDDVFGIFKVEGNPEYFAKKAIRKLKEKTTPIS